jgi:NAD kinase
MTYKILIVEKKSDAQDAIDSSQPKNQSKHDLTRSKLLELLRLNNIHFKITIDSSINQFDFVDYNIIISLGGDGTFLKCSSKTTDQIIFGINSDTDSSVGELLAYDINTIDKIVKSISKENIKTEKWKRLKATVNGKELEFGATNEIYIGKRNIFQTSKLNLNIKSVITNNIGNGILFSTQKGCTGFYSSAGGEAINEAGYGYVFVLPYLIANNVAKSSVLSESYITMISPIREDHILIFDCDQATLIELNPKDQIEIFLDSKNPLTVAV